jgi:HPr kinase/phosphorylase
MKAHATTVAVHHRGVMLLGPSCSGKSDLALRLLGQGALLVADDCTTLRRQGGVLLAAPPPAIAGKLEVRGVGIVSVPWVTDTPVHLIMELKPREAIDRLPDPKTIDLLGVPIPAVAVYPFEASAALKVVQALILHGLRPTL